MNQSNGYLVNKTLLLSHQKVLRAMIHNHWSLNGITFPLFIILSLHPFLSTTSKFSVYIIYFSLHNFCIFSIYQVICIFHMTRQPRKFLSLSCAPLILFSFQLSSNFITIYIELHSKQFTLYTTP